MANGFDARNPPFDRLTHGEVEELRAALDIGYFRPGEVIVRRGGPSDFLHVVIKGAVEGRDDDKLEAVLARDDSFDARAVVHGAAGEDFIAAEETLCYLLPRSVILSLVARNPAFAAFFYSEISRKLDAFAHEQRPDGVEAVLRAHVREARYGAAVFIDGATTVEAAGHRMRETGINALFVRDGDRVGVVTGMNLAKVAVLGRQPLSTPVRDACHFEVVSIDADDLIFEALLLMTRHNKRRLAVRSGGAFIGFLEDIDILGLFAGNSQLIPGRIERATSLGDLEVAARDIQAQVERLHRQGVRVEAIAEITSDLNARLHAKLFHILAPASVREAGCLILMGSEGRGEQTARTDQDNGLLLAHEVSATDIAAFRDAFSGALDRFGFPPCPGDVMVRNPVWSQPVDDLIRQLRLWVLERSPAAAMNIAIFFDAVAVTGRGELLARAKTALLDLMRGETALLARFAHLIETFATPNLGLLGTLMVSVGAGHEEMDIKRVGIFPIVHGVRALAMERGILAQSTVARLDALASAGAIDPDFRRELIGALHVFMEFRLRVQLQAVRRGTIEGESIVRLSQLSTTDRDILRDGLRVVRQLREIVRHHFQLGAF